MDLTPTLDAPEVRRLLVRFVKDYVERSGAEGAVLGLSGGVDSAVVLALAVEALGAENVLPIALPHETSTKEDEIHARMVAHRFNVDMERVDITPVVDAAARACADHPPTERAEANMKSRARMLLLYAHANSMNRLVLGTGNKSELLTGYFTKYGDGGADLYPIGDLYKTQVWALARELDVPEVVIQKAPTAGLSPGQTDEDELGIRYSVLDQILLGVESGHAPDAIAAHLKLPDAKVREVLDRVRAAEHKRSSLVVPKVGFRTPGLDWRMPRTQAAEEAK